MRTLSRLSLSSIAIFVLVACQTIYNPLDEFEQLEPKTSLAPPEPLPSTVYSSEDIAHGKYLVGLLGCGTCHTDGAYIGIPNPERLLAGSRTGIAYSNPLENINPAVVFPANLTPDWETGLGSRSDAQAVQMIQLGIIDHGRRSIPVMPRAAYANITSQDALSIVAYLKSLAPVRHQVPSNVVRGQRTAAPFVHFGVYQRR